ncbi:hypothetical protein HWV62_30551 [Athelia sp. TMB]|nr:hypothetical protein HWV62_30551 [Athelia sp. TMB]
MNSLGQQQQYQQQPYGPRAPSRTPSVGSSAYQHGRAAQDVATGAIGGGYGPYSYNPQASRDAAPSRFSTAPPSEASHNDVQSRERIVPAPAPNNSSTVPPYLWDTKDPDLDDMIHDPRNDSGWAGFTIFSFRGWVNASAIVVLMVGLIMLFAGYPIISWYRRSHISTTGYNLGGINGTGQVPKLPGMPSLIDAVTPSSAFTRKGSDGNTYNLVFSDEFNTDGRTFYPGDDAYWEAVNFNYWPTGDLEWYDPSTITTKDGKLVITLSEVQNHDLNFMSGMLQSWNKFCFTTGYIEVSVSMPGTAEAAGLWPAVWTMGNLGRAGYGATTEGNYDACDLGTFPNQTAQDGTPGAYATAGSLSGNELSFLPGQRGDHPGPSNNVGRSAPEIDIFETQINVTLFKAEVSQSLQTAPFNYKYEFVNTSDATTIYDDTITQFNSYKGGTTQQGVSATSIIDSQNFGGNGYATYGYEWWSNPSKRSEGYVTWYSQGVESWKITAASIGPDPLTQISQRLIPEEPMYIIMNLGLSPGFQRQDWKHLVFPTSIYVDYVRVYQRDDVKDGVGCDPASHPTADYINNHPVAYADYNATTWAQANYTFPRNSLYDGC